MKTRFIGFGLAYVIPLALSAQFCFTNALNFTNSTTPNSATFADFNGDGKLDAAVVSNTIEILLGSGSGSIFSNPSYVSVFTDPRTILSGDFNKDGKPDIATANQGSNDVAVFLGNGIGGFSTKPKVTVGVSPMAMVQSDFNGDGIIDLATANFTSKNISILLGDGIGGFTASSFITSTANAPLYLTVTDMNKDGKKDLLVTTQNGFEIYTGNGLGGFSYGYNAGFVGIHS